jgi:hypothetical protein
MDKPSKLDLYVNKLLETERKVMLIKKVKEYCDQEVEINEEHPWHTITDGTGDICRGRLEFAEGLLNQIEKWENENVTK